MGEKNMSPEELIRLGFREYYKKNKARISENKKRYYERHKERICEERSRKRAVGKDA